MFRTLANRSFTYNRHYAERSISYSLTPLLLCSLLLISDIEGCALSASPSLKYNLAQELDNFIGAISAYQKNGAENISDFTEYYKKCAAYAGMQWWF